jgi:hypothetical protein
MEWMPEAPQLCSDVPASRSILRKMIPLRPKSCVFARVLDANDLLDHNVG